MYKAGSREIELGGHRPDRVAHDPVVVHLAQYSVETRKGRQETHATATIVWVEKASNGTGQLFTRAETLHSTSWSEAGAEAMNWIENNFGGFEKPAPANRDEWFDLNG
jgi:hypothetical protein